MGPIPNFDSNPDLFFQIFFKSFFPKDRSSIPKDLKKKDRFRSGSIDLNFQIFIFIITSK